MEKGYLTEEQIKEIEEKIGYSFKDKNLLSTAFRRKSYTEELGNDASNLPNNETLEFYGDSVLNMIVVKAVADIASKSYKEDVKPERNEEALTHFVSNYTDKSMLASIIEPTNLSKYLIMSKGDLENEVYKEESVMEDLFEAIVGAMWFDNNLNIDSIYYHVARMLDLKTDREDFYKKNAFVQLKEFLDRNPDFSIKKISGTLQLWHVAYDYPLTSTSVGGLFLGMGRYQTMISNAQFFIDVLKKMHAWDMEKKIDIEGITPENAINKLQELFQKKIIPTNPIYPKENEYFDRETNLWNVDCVYIVGGSAIIETGEGKHKPDAKKIAAYKMYMTIANELND